MIKSSEEKINDNKPLKSIEVITTKVQENNTSETIAYTTGTLMPELEELIKKNPNLLIGCGG